MEEIKLDGLEEIIKKIEKMEDKTAATRGITKACAFLEGEAKKKAQANGNKRIAQSITYEVNGLEGVVFTPLFYAPYVEFGTGIYAEGGKGRKEVPWVYVEGSGSADRADSKTVYTEEEARKTVAYLRSKGLDAKMTKGQEPKPFLRPALYENQKRLIEIMWESITDA
jgi:HK97 gp10 family phage protein